MSEEKRYDYSNYNEFNRFENLDSIEAKIIMHLVKSKTKHANLFWKILKYNDLYALSQPEVSEAERLKLVNNDNGEPTTKRVFLSPFVDDAWEEQCSSVYIFVDHIYPFDHLRATIGVTVETIVHSKISAIVGDGDPILNPNLDDNGNPIPVSNTTTHVGTYGANPNDWLPEEDSGNQEAEPGSIVVPFKNRATVLLKCVLAELNGLYLDGIGYLQLNARDAFKGKVEMPLFNRRSFYGHSTTFSMVLSGESESSEIGY